AGAGQRSGERRACNRSDYVAPARGTAVAVRAGMTSIRRALPFLFLAACVTGGSSDNSAGTGTQQRPATCPPADAFDHALCLCEDMNDVGQLSVVEGPAGVGSVGVNGFTRFVNLTRAVGDWIAYGGFEAATD